MSSIIRIPQIDHSVYNASYSSHLSYSEDNLYIPIHSLKDATVYRVDGEILMVYNFWLGVTGFNTGSISLFTKIGRDKTYWHRYKFKAELDTTATHHYYSNQGAVVYHDKNSKETEVLMMLCLKRKFLSVVNRENPDPRMFIIIVDNKFIRDAEHFKIYRNVKKNYLDLPEIRDNIDVLYTNDLNKQCYNQETIQMPTFTTIEDMIKGFSHLNKRLEEILK